MIKKVAFFFALIAKSTYLQDRDLYQPKDEAKLKMKLPLFEDQRPEYLLELAHGYVKKGQKPK